MKPSVIRRSCHRQNGCTTYWP